MAGPQGSRGRWPPGIDTGVPGDSFLDVRNLVARHPAWAVVALLAVLLAGGVARSALAPVEVTTVSLAEREIVSTIAVVGRVRAPSRAGLGASIAGTVADVSVDVGDAVQRNQVLLVLDDREQRALLLEAEAALAGQIASSAEAIAQAERDSAQSARDADRMQAVFLEGAVTRQRLEQEVQRAADAASRLRSLRAMMSAGAGEPAPVTRARAARDAAEARLALTRVRAPAAGTILARMVEPGDAVSPGRALLDMAFDGPAELIVFPSEESLPLLRVGGPATASADAFPDSVFEATVVRVAPSVDAGQGTVEVRLAVPRAPSFLRPDMTVSVNVEAGRNLSAAVVPEVAVRGLGTPTPWVVVVREGRAARTDVDVGLRAGDFVEILGGVGAGDRVVTSPADVEVGTSVEEVGAPLP